MELPLREANIWEANPVKYLLDSLLHLSYIFQKADPKTLSRYRLSRCTPALLAKYSRVYRLCTVLYLGLTPSIRLCSPPLVWQGMLVLSLFLLTSKLKRFCSMYFFGNILQKKKLNGKDQGVISMHQFNVSMFLLNNLPILWYTAQSWQPWLLKMMAGLPSLCFYITKLARPSKKKKK